PAPDDRIRNTPYAASGSYTVPNYDAGAPVVLQNASWIADVFTGNTLVLEVRTGTTPTPTATATTTDPNWTTFRAVSSGGVVGGTSRYAQYRLTLSTTVPNAAPALKEVALTFVR